MAASSVFEARWRQYGREVETLYDRLYLGDRQSLAALKQMLQSRFEERRPDMREIDRKRRSGWLSGEPGLCIACSARENTGIFLKLGETAPEYAAAHASALRLSHVWDGDNAFLGVPEAQGGEAGLAGLAQICRQQNMLLGVEVEMDATSREHPWMQAGRTERYCAYATPDLPNLCEHGLEGSRGHFVRENGMYYMCQLQKGRYDLNYQNPDVLASVLDFLLRLCNLGVDVLFLKHVSALWKIPGTACACLPETAALLRLLRLCMAMTAPAAAVVLDTEEMRWSEGIADGVEGARWIPTLWHTLATGNTALLKEETAWRLEYPVPAVCRSLFGENGVSWDLDYAFLSRMGWQERPHRQYLNDYFAGRWPGEKTEGRDDGEGGIQGTAMRLCGGDSGKLMLLCALMLCLGEMGSMDAEVFCELKEPVLKLFALLRPLRAFSGRAARKLVDTETDDVLVLRRDCEGETLYALFHFGTCARQLSLDGPDRARDLWTGEDIPLDSVRIEPRCFRLLETTEG